MHLRVSMADTQRTIEFRLRICDSGSGGDQRCPQWVTGRCQIVVDLGPSPVEHRVEKKL